MSLKLIGAAISPFVRKVRVVLAEKALSYDHDPMVPFGVSDEYKRMHPLGKIPVLVDGDKIIPDSSPICVYLEKTHPDPALYPSEAYELARALWFEEYADAGFIAGTIIPFQERILGPVFFKREGDEAKVEAALNETLPEHFDYLERELGENDWLVGNRFSIADIATGTQFVSFSHGRATVDAKRWPGLAAYVDRVFARPSFKAIIEEEQASLKSMAG
ncbi:MAG TPA: glutathione S-transferase family protein [Deltaproteobacteria bacterium]|nr:glutathione S-transferase family protein [Deltaproteobacteria bacterium]